jgi:hypothetical protein
MPFEPETLLQEIDSVLSRIGVIPGDHISWVEIRDRHLPTSELYSIGTALLSIIQRLTADHSGYRFASAQIAEGAPLDDPVIISRLVGVLSAFRSDVEAGFTRTVEELIHADVFADFLEMAEELIEKTFKDAAAVIVGSVLEEHLRKLALGAGVPVTDDSGHPINADTINANLTKAIVYNKLEQKSVTAWLGLRNSAAHGHYDDYDLGQVKQLLADIRAFMIRHPA